MRKFRLSEYAPDTVDYYVRQIPFFARLAREDAPQFHLLMQHTCIIELEAGEVLIEKGTFGHLFYSLVHGQLAVFQQRRPGDKAISEVLPSQIFGVLSIINQIPRTATIMVSSVEGATVFCTDYAVFGELDDFSRVSLRTKLFMLRELARHILQTLHDYEENAPDEALSRELSMLLAYDGETDSLEELEYLAELATALAWLLRHWNARVTPSVPLFDESLIEKKLVELMKPHPRQ